jgi:hypothetical protein
MSLVGRRRRSKDSISLCIGKERKRRETEYLDPTTIKKMFNSTVVS